MVTPEERIEPQALGNLSHPHELVIGRALLGLGEDT
jgi:hypothetical protein